MQFQCVLRTDLTIPDDGPDVTPIRIDLAQGTEYALLPIDGDSKATTIWYQGDVYDFASSPSGSRGVSPGGPSNFARSLALPPGQYKLLVRAMYEIRMFGDPGYGKAPTIDMLFRAGVDEADEAVEVLGGLRVIPDMVDGWMMGEWISLPIRVRADCQGAGDAILVSATGEVEGTDIKLELLHQGISIRASQTRPVAFRVKQDKKVQVEKALVSLAFELEISSRQHRLTWRHPITQKRLEEKDPFLITVPSPLKGEEMALVSYAMVVPPRLPLVDSNRLPPVLLGLHGAGVDVESPFWADALPSVLGMWAVLPSGKNEWGEDWHGGSASDVFAARAAVSGVIAKLGERASEQTL